MKVDNSGSSIQTTSTEPASRLLEVLSPAPGAGATTSAPDALSLSSDVQLVQQALTQASALPDVRADVVARMRDLLERGELGQDADRLADAIIDRWLTTP